MTQLAFRQVRNRLMDRGLTRRQARIGAAIALCEAPTLTDPPKSNFDAIGDQELADETWGFSYGGFQIRSLRAHKGTGKFRDEDLLLNPAFNLDSAATIFRFSGWEPWSTYTSGMYKAFLPDLFPPPENTHVVMPGQTLSLIAELYDFMTWEDLARWNNIHSPYTIYIGQILQLGGTDLIAFGDNTHEAD